MSNTANDGEQGGERIDLETEQVWLSDMLARDKPNPFGEEPVPGWVLKSLQRQDDEVEGLAPRAKAFLDAGGNLAEPQLAELSRYLGIVWQLTAGTADATSDSAEAEALRKKAEGFWRLNDQVTRLRRHRSEG